MNLTERCADRPIQVGDLVAIVRWPCCGAHVGAIWTVEEIVTRERNQLCEVCKTGVGRNVTYAVNWTAHQCAPLAWLKRIPPLDELESTKTDEPIQEPA